MNRFLVAIIATVLACVTSYAQRMPESLKIGGGFGSTGVDIEADGDLKLDGTITLTSNLWTTSTPENAIWQQNTTTNTATRYYLIPKGTPTGSRSVIKLFATDWVADGTNYADFNVAVTDAMTDISASGFSVMLNSKVNGSITDPMDIAFVFQDGAEIAGRVIYNGGNSGWIFGDTATNYMSTHSTIQLAADALFMNAKGIRWRGSSGTANNILKIGTTNAFEFTADATTVLVANATEADFAGNVDIGSGKVYKVNGTQISSTALSNDSNIAKLDGSTRTRLSTVTDAGPMTATNGTVGDLVLNTADSKVYVCTTTGTPGTWAALN